MLGGKGMALDRLAATAAQHQLVFSCPCIVTEALAGIAVRFCEANN